jgi:hypothetical protein
VPWQVEHEIPNEFTCLSCFPVFGGMAWQLPQAGVGGVYVQDCVVTGVPEQPAGDEAVTVRVWVLFDWHAPQAE